MGTVDKFNVAGGLTVLAWLLIVGVLALVNPQSTVAAEEKARSVPESVSTTGLEHELYVRLVCNVEGDKLLFVPGVEGEGWAYCTAVK